MKNHAHIKAEINDGQITVDVQGNGNSLALILAEVMKQLDARGYAEVVATAMHKFFDYLPD